MGARTAAATALAAAALLAACAIESVEWQNRRPAHELAERARPAGSLYAGWRVFQDRCAACHGPAATGTGQAPDLLPRLRTMGPRGFASVVLVRYDWGLAPAQPGAAARDTLVDDVLQRRAGAVAMPAWQGEPRVTAHIGDLFAWLSARAEGTQGPERPAPD